MGKRLDNTIMYDHVVLSIVSYKKVPNHWMLSSELTNMHVTFNTDLRSEMRRNDRINLVFVERL